MSALGVTRQHFLQIMESLQKQDEAYTLANGAIDYAGMDFGNILLAFNTNAGLVLQLLGMLCGLGQSSDLLSWWFYDKHYGQDFRVGDLVLRDLPDDHPWHCPDISTREKLWEYIVYLSEGRKHDPNIV